MRRWLALAGVLVLAPVAGCVSFTDPLGRHEALEETQRKYTDLVRWGDLEAAEVFVDPEFREEFKDLAADFAKLRITDHAVGEIEHGGRTAYVSVTYKGYSIVHLVEHTSKERQEWIRSGITNAWHVRPQLAVLLAELQGLPRASALE